MIGSVAGLTLHDGYNPFKSGELAKELAQAVHKLALAKSEIEWNKANTTFHATEERVAQALHDGRPEFVRRAQAAGLSYAEADAVFRRLEEAVAEARRRGGEIRSWFIPTHRKRIKASVGYRPGDDLLPGEDGWALSWQYNTPHVDAATHAVLQALNELDRVAHFMMAHAPAAVGITDTPVAVTGEEVDIIKFLRKCPGRTCVNADIEVGADLAKATVAKYVNTLIAKGLAHKPNGERKGVTLTAEGQRFAAR